MCLKELSHRLYYGLYSSTPRFIIQKLVEDEKFNFLPIPIVKSKPVLKLESFNYLRTASVLS